MTATTTHEGVRPGQDTSSVVIVSGDTHIGPRLKEELREYCPPEHLEAFDAFEDKINTDRATMFEQASDDDKLSMSVMMSGAMGIQIGKNLQTAGHYDMHARLKDYDRDGVAAGVLIHGSQNGQPIPFRTSPFEGSYTGDDLEYSAIGYHIYNQWLADVCTIEPERHVGLAYVPLWDVDAAIAEATWAREAGLKAVHLPGPQEKNVPYNRPEWEPFWSAIEDLDMPLIGHGGQDHTWEYSGPEAAILQMIEGGGWMARRHLHWMAYSGVFYRHPKLRVVITEISGDWWANQLAEMDGVYLSPAGAPARARVPELPSEGAMRCVFGAWWLCPHEVQHALADGFYTNLMWGSDYPHLEGTWRLPEPTETVPQTQLHLRYAFGGVGEREARAMVSDNGLRVYGLDREALQKVADRIEAPTLDEIRRPLPAEEIPNDNPGIVYPFRTNWSWS